MTKTQPTFHSIFESPWEGSMTLLLEKAGMTNVNLHEADIIVFNGGADIGTSIYGENPVYPGIPYVKSLRDKREIAVYDEYVGKGKLLVGICRGAQLLNCLNGGTLWQDVNNHGRNHQMTVLETGERMQITSTHHQMMRPNFDKAKIIAVADEAHYKDADGVTYSRGLEAPKGLSQVELERWSLDNIKDMEILYYPDTNCLCIQGHPEYVPGTTFAEYCIGLINHYYNEVKNVAAA